MIALSETQNIRGKAGEANKVTYTITGSQIAAGVGTYKVLAQGELGAATAILYEVPASNQVLVSHILLSNTSAAVQTITLYVDGAEAKNQIARIIMPANGTATFDRDGWKVIDEKGRLQQGVEGPAGSTGEPGPKGEMLWREVWSSATTYAKGDAVEEGGSSYVSLKAANTNHKPSALGEWWGLVAKVGKEGPEGKEGKEGKEGTSKLKLKVEARVEHTSATFEIEPSATENASVTVDFISKTSSAYAYKVYVGGTLVDEVNDPSFTEKQNQSGTYLVPAAAKLKVEKVTGETEKVFTQITMLGIATGAEGTLKQYASYHAAEVLATGTTIEVGALQSGEEDKLSITAPTGGGYYEVAAQITAKNPGTGFGGAILKVDGVAVRWTNTTTGESLTPNQAKVGSGTFETFCFDDTTSQGESKGWRHTTAAGGTPTPELGMGISVVIFLPEGAHTIGLYLFNEDRTGGKIKERRLVATGP